jgi:hypothetical protein
MSVYFNGPAISSLDGRRADKRISQNNYVSILREMLSKSA